MRLRISMMFMEFRFNVEISKRSHLGWQFRTMSFEYLVIQSYSLFQQLLIHLYYEFKQLLLNIILFSMGNKLCCQTTQQKTNQALISINKTGHHESVILTQFLKENQTIQQILSKIKEEQKIKKPGSVFSQEYSSFVIPSTINFSDKDPQQLLLYENTLSQGIFLSQQPTLEKKERNGFGIMLYKSDGNDSKYYEGYWKDDMRDNWGISICEDGNSYVGGWFEDLPHQFGNYKSSRDKIEYIGQWNKGEKEGNARQYYEDGTIYEGEFKNNQIQGIGIFKGHKQRYQGDWKKGKMHGSGKTQWLDDDGKVIASYIGQYFQGKKQGYGQYTDSKGKIYKATWVDGQINENAPITKEVVK